MSNSIFILARRFRREDGDWSEPTLEDRSVSFTGPETDWMPTIHPILKRPFEERWVEFVPKSELAESRAGGEGWIACEDRMPDTNRDVMFVMYGNTHCYGYWSRGHWWDKADSSYDGPDRVNAEHVTHWRELPALPATR